MDLESMLNMIQQAGDDEEEEGDDEGLIMQGQEEDEEDEEGMPSIQGNLYTQSISIHSISWCVPPIRMETLCHPHLCDGLHCWIKA